MAEIGFALSFDPEESLVPPPSPEASLARAAARGDRVAFGRLVDLHKRAVFGLCVRLLRDGEEARDAAQEAFVRGYAAIATYDPAQPFAPWILRIARNHCLDLVRRRVPAAQQVALDADPEDGAPAYDLPDAASPAADLLLEQAQTRSALEAAVAELPANYREVIQLFHVEHLSYKEIAATLDVPIGTVMTWLHRARGKLRATLEARGLEVRP
ncbi:MAG TPA: sigma-70 family RNA polymerase sigma factor [Anaeromyxobacteraceae bacterium]|nr:sigma-70 family RNA polymerase sigma factor [Anaeromyxobacteraceae bacterium]